MTPKFNKVKLKTLVESHDSGFWGNEAQGDQLDISVIRSTNFSNDGILSLDDIATRNFPKNKYIEKKLKYGDILIERSGGSDIQPVGRVGFVDQNIDNIYSFANFIERLRCIDKSYPKYVYYLLQQRYESGETNSMQNQTTGIRNIDMKHYLNSLINYIDDIEEQKRIVYVLDKTDEAIKSTKKSIEKAQRLKKSLMQNLLTGKMKSDGTWRKENEFYIDSKFGRVPKGWKYMFVGDKSLCDINPNYKLNKNEEYDFIPMDAIEDSFSGKFIFERKIYDGGSFSRFKNGDILLAKITPCTENGKLALISGSDKGVGFGSTEFIIFSPKTINGLFLYYILQSEKIHNLCVSLMEGSTGRQRIPWKIFKNRVGLGIPENIQEQIDISKKIKVFDDKILFNEEKKEKLQKLKKSLMQHLLTGKIRIPENTFDLTK